MPQIESHIHVHFSSTQLSRRVLNKSVKCAERIPWYSKSRCRHFSPFPALIDSLFPHLLCSNRKLNFGYRKHLRAAICEQKKEERKSCEFHILKWFFISHLTTFLACHEEEKNKSTHVLWNNNFRMIEGGRIKKILNRFLSDFVSLGCLDIQAVKDKRLKVTILGYFLAKIITTPQKVEMEFPALFFSIKVWLLQPQRPRNVVKVKRHTNCIIAF